MATGHLLGRKWFKGLVKYERDIIAAIEEGEARLLALGLGDIPISARKHASTEIIKSAVEKRGVPCSRVPMGGTHWLLVPGVAILRVKALNRFDQTSNYQTATHAALMDGELLPDFPALPRIDLVYVMDEVTGEIRLPALREWSGNECIAEYRLPWRLETASSTEALELPLPDLTPTVRPKTDAAVAAKRARPKRGLAG